MAELLGALGQRPYMLRHGQGRDAYHLVMLPVSQGQTEALTAPLGHVPATHTLGTHRFLALPLGPRSQLGDLPEGLYVPERKVWSETIALYPYRSKGATSGDESVVSGLLLEADGLPCEGAEVTLRRERFFGPGKGKVATVGPTGTFVAEGLLRGSYELGLTGEAVGRLEVTIGNVPAGTEELIIRLAAAHSIGLTVTGPKGRPVAGASVRLRPCSPGGSPWLGRWQEAPPTNDQGLHFFKLREGQTCEYAAWKTPHQPAGGLVDLSTGPPARTKVEVKLPRGCALKGTIVASAGGPSRAAVVRVARPTASLGPRGQWMAPLPYHEGSCLVSGDAAGSFFLEGLPEDVLRLDVFADTDCDVFLGRTFVVTRLGTSATETRVLLESPGSIVGRLFDEGGTPIEAVAYLCFYGASTNVLGSRYTADVADDGSFLVPIVAPGTYRAKWRREDSPDRLTAPRHVNVEAGGQTSVHLGGGGPGAKTLRGRLTRGGTPIEPCEVVAIPVSDVAYEASYAMRYLSGTRRAVVSDDGRFEMVGILPGPYTLLTDDGDGTGCSRHIVFDGRSTEVTIPQDGARLDGRLTCTGGTPIAGASVEVLPSQGNRNVRLGLLRTVQTGSTGRFCVAHLAPGRYDISCELPGRGDVSLVERFDVTAPVTRLDIALPLVKRLTGSVLDQRGRPLSSAMVLLHGERCRPVVAAVTGSDGTFESVMNPDVGTVTVTVVQPGYAIETGRIDAAYDGVFDAVLVPGGDVAVTVVGPADKRRARIVRAASVTGRPVGRLRSDVLEALSEATDHPVFLQPTDESGATNLRALRPGTYRVSVEGSEATTSVTVKALETSVARIVVE